MPVTIPNPLLQATQHDEAAAPQGRLWFIVGAKGGCGATVLTTSLAWAMAAQGLRVVVVDLDLAHGQAAMHLCERNAGPTVRDAMFVLGRMDATLLGTLLTPCAPGLHLLPSPTLSRWTASEPDYAPEHLRQLCRSAAELADVVLVDLPSHALQPPVQTGWQRWLAEADHRVLVTEPTLSATFNARRCLERLRPALEGSGEDLSWEVVLNKVDKADAMHPSQVRRALGCAPEQADRRADEQTAGGSSLRWRELPRSDAAVASAVHQGMAVGQLLPRDALARALDRWALEARDGTPTGWLNGLLKAWAPVAQVRGQGRVQGLGQGLGQGQGQGQGIAP